MPALRQYFHREAAVGQRFQRSIDRQVMSTNSRSYMYVWGAAFGAVRALALFWRLMREMAKFISAFPVTRRRRVADLPVILAALGFLATTLLRFEHACRF
jgi:hypothetical protein